LKNTGQTEEVIPTIHSEQLELSSGAPQPSEKEEKIEKQRVEVLNSVAAGRLNTMQEKVAWILNHHPETRDSDIHLQVRYWRQFESDIFEGNSIQIGDYYKLTRLTSITRERARIQNIFQLFIASDEIRKTRGTIEKSEHQKSVEQHISYHNYAVYLDESGKTGDHLIVGSVWLLDGGESFKILSRLENWKKANSFDGELHFKEISDGKLNQYFGVADFIAENSSVMSFKAISVERKGTGNVADALNRLFYHLLVKGIETEHQSGRAPLPRLLQVWKDAEEAGRDKLFLADLRTRLNEASNTLFDGKLLLNEFFPVKSDENALIQIADLFTSSINRVLNASGERKHAKDKFADYLLARLNLPKGPTVEELEGDMTVHVAL
jgi:hypothetical protein